MKRLLALLVVLGILLPTFLVTSPVFADSTKQDYFETDTSWGSRSLYEDEYGCQTFTASATYSLTSVTIKAWMRDMGGDPPEVIAEIYAVDSNGKPTGSSLASGSADSTSWTTVEANRTFYEITMDSPYQVDEGTKYAIVIESPDGGYYTYCLVWERNDDLYATGQGWLSINGGSTWSGGYYDWLFQVYGEIGNSPATITVNAVSDITQTSGTVNVSLTSLGSNSEVDLSVNWGYIADDLEFNTTPETYTSAPDILTEELDLLPGHPIYYRIITDGDVIDWNSAVQTVFYTLGPPYTVSENNDVSHSGVLTHVFQRKSWYAAGRYWILYCKGYLASPTGGFYWKSSTDGITWSEPYLFKEAFHGITYPLDSSGNESDELNTYFDGTYIHAVYLYNRYDTAYDLGSEIWYRRGIPNANGTITWTYDWAIASDNSGTTVRGYASIVTDTNGYPFIDYWESASVDTTPGLTYGTPTGQWDRKVIKSSTKDGTFTVASGYPYTLKANIGFRGTGVLVQLPGGMLYWVGCREQSSSNLDPWIGGRLYNGSTWGSEEQIATDCHGYYRFSVVSRGSIIYVVYTNKDNKSLEYTKRSVTGWTTPVTIVSDMYGGGSNTYSPAAPLSINQATGDLYLFYMDWSDDTIKYMTCPASTAVWGEAITLADESYFGLTFDYLSTTISSTLEVFGGKLGVFYGQATPSWYVVGGFDYITLRFTYLEVEAGAAVQTNEATDVTSTTATMQGYLINNGGQATQVRFDWGTSIAYGSTTAWQSKTTGESFSAELTDLTPTQTYYFRAEAKWADNTTTYGLGKIFGATSSTATVTLSAASSVSYTTATLPGDITNTGGNNPTVTIYWGTVNGGQVVGNWQHSSYPTAPTQPQGSDVFFYNVTGLNPSTKYYFSAKAVNSVGTSWPVASLYFTTSSYAITVTTDAATNVTVTTARLHGYLDDDGGSVCQYRFEYGLTDGYGSFTTWTGAINSTDTFQATITGLAPNTTYHFMAVCINSYTIGYGEDETLITYDTTNIGSPIIILAEPKSGTQIAVSWESAEGATSTMLRYRIDTYPIDWEDGTLAYDDVYNSVTLEGLTPGTTYYFTAWGIDPGGYYSGETTSATATTFALFGGTWQTDPVDPQPSNTPDSSKLSGAPGYGLGAWVANQMHFSVTSFYLIMALILISLLTALIAVTTKSVGWTALSIIVMVAVCVAVGVVPMFAAYLLGIIILPLAVIKGIQTVS